MPKPEKTHLTWSIEVGNKCPCGGEPMLCLPMSRWEIDSEDRDYEERGGDVGVDEEVSGHVCRKCGRLTSLSLNVL